MSGFVIKTVRGPKFIELGEPLRPIIQFVADYTKGGLSGIDGRKFEPGYYISARHFRLGLGISRSVVIDGKGNPSECVMRAEKFSIKTLFDLAESAKRGVYDPLLASLYAEAREKWSEHQWPDSPFDSDCVFQWLAEEATRQLN